MIQGLSTSNVKKLDSPLSELQAPPVKQNCAKQSNADMFIIEADAITKVAFMKLRNRLKMTISAIAFLIRFMIFNLGKS